MLAIGFSSYIPMARIIGIFAPHYSLAKEMRSQAKKDNRLILANHGRKTRALVVTDSNHVICSSVSAEVLQGKMESNHRRYHMTNINGLAHI